MFKVTTAVKRIRAMKARKKVIPGSSSAGKTIAILIILIDMCTKRHNLEVSVIAESIPHLKRGALKDFLKIMKATGRFNASRYNATDRKYTFANGAYMEFFSPESVIGSRRNVLYINEANYIKYDDYHQMAIRTSDEIFIDFNPANEFWAHTEVARESNAEMITLTYLDNESRPSNVDEEFAIALEKAAKEESQGLPITSYWRNWCEVYVHGRTGNLQGVIFNNWDQIDEVPNIPFIGSGLDFGFTNDPSALIAVFVKGKDIYLDQLIYEPGLITSDLVAKFPVVGVTIQDPIIADSANPMNIAEIKRSRYSIEPAKKGQDSIKVSIDKLQEYKIHITKRSTDLIKEFRSYRWKVDASGKSLNEPIDFMNHGIDAVRYVVLNKILNTTYSKFY